MHPALGTRGGEVCGRLVLVEVGSTFLMWHFKREVVWCAEKVPEVAKTMIVNSTKSS